MIKAFLCFIPMDFYDHHFLFFLCVSEYFKVSLNLQFIDFYESTVWDWKLEIIWHTSSCNLEQSTRDCKYILREIPQNSRTKFSRPLPNCTKWIFLKSACLKSNFGTNLEFLSPAVAEKFLGKVGLFCLFFAFPAIHALTKLFVTFDGLNRFFQMIACFKGNDNSVHPALLEFWNSTL